MTMSRKMLKAALTAAMSLAFAVPAFASPFSDVPAKHWSYDAVSRLSQAGIVDGYSDGTFKGEKTVTRYEMAQIVAKAMQKSLNTEQKASVDKLAREFSTELNAMGIKVDGVQQQVNNMVKISGDARVRYFDTEAAPDYTDYRARVTLDGKLNDSIKFNARLATGSTNIDQAAGGIRLDTANAVFDMAGAEVTAGRQDIKIGTGFMMDTQMNGVAAKAGDFKMFGGIATSNNTSGNIPVAQHAGSVMHMYGAEYSTNLAGAKVNFDYLKDATHGTDNYGINTSFGITNGVSANAEYIKNSTDSGTAVAYGVKFDKVGLSATYRDVDASAFSDYSTMVNPAFDTGTSAGGFKGMEYQFDRALDKNVNFTAKYQDFDKKSDGTKLGAHASAAINVKF